MLSVTDQMFITEFPLLNIPSNDGIYLFMFCFGSLAVAIHDLAENDIQFHILDKKLGLDILTAKVRNFDWPSIKFRGPNHRGTSITSALKFIFHLLVLLVAIEKHGSNQHT